jgi:DNA-binding beta-propeller fold protein YncE
VVATIRVPYEPQGIVASPDGTRVYVISAAYVVNGNNYASSAISTIDTATNGVVATITRPEYDSGLSISPDGKTLYVSAAVPCGCASGQNGAYIDVIGTANGSVREFRIPSISGSAQEVIYNVVISPDNSKLYSNHSYYYQSLIDEVAVLNPATGAEITTLPAVLTVGAFSPNSQYLYGVGLGGVGVINTATDVSTTAIANIPGASALAITPDGQHLYITDASTGSVLVADTATYTISTVLPLAVAASGAIAIVSAP